MTAEHQTDDEGWQITEDRIHAHRIAACGHCGNVMPDVECAVLSLQLALRTARAALTSMVYETTHLSPRNDDGSHDCRISAATLAAAREALRT
jgi:hypothetical protein